MFNYFTVSHPISISEQMNAFIVSLKEENYNALSQSNEDLLVSLLSSFSCCTIKTTAHKYSSFRGSVVKTNDLQTFPP